MEHYEECNWLSFHHHASPHIKAHDSLVAISCIGKTKKIALFTAPDFIEAYRPRVVQRAQGDGIRRLKGTGCGASIRKRTAPQ